MTEVGTILVHDERRQHILNRLVTEHPLVVPAAEEGYHRIGQGPVDDGAGIDGRDEGMIQGLISDDSVGSSDLHLGLARMKPGEYHLLHHHPHGSEFYFILEGAGIMLLADQGIRVSRRTAIYIPRNCVHGFYNDSAGTVEMLYGLSLPDYRDMGVVYDE